MHFIGIVCTLSALSREVKSQLDENSSVCPECWFAFLTLHRNVKKYEDTSRLFAMQMELLKKRGEKYWDDLDKLNKQCKTNEKDFNKKRKIVSFWATKTNMRGETKRVKINFIQKV
jgi:hypothetical protein